MSAPRVSVCVCVCLRVLKDGATDRRMQGLVLEGPWEGVAVSVNDSDDLACHGTGSPLSSGGRSLMTIEVRIES